MPSISDIRHYFDDASLDRDHSISIDPILSYEQETRQRAVLDLLNVKPTDVVMDVGCGNARDIVQFIKRADRVYGLDFSDGMIREGLKKLRPEPLESYGFVTGTAMSLPFQDESFDKVSCSEVVEHIPHWEQSLSEVVRVLKKGGRVAITTPNRRSLYSYMRPAMRGASYLYGLLTRREAPHHPHDEWKTQEEVVSRLESLGVRVDRRLGICFIPSHGTYLLPHRAKTLLVELVSRVEKIVRHRFHRSGYMLGISGKKI